MENIDAKFLKKSNPIHRELQKKHREQNLNGEITHEEYFEWLCNYLNLPERLVPVSLEALLNSKDEHLNDIPLQRWDNMHKSVLLYVKGGMHWSLSDSVCCLKHLARRMINREKQK